MKICGSGMALHMKPAVRSHGAASRSVDVDLVDVVDLVDFVDQVH